MALQSNIKKAHKTSEEIGELLDQLSKLLDRTKVMYEQYFMGIQKLPPSQLHRDIERRIRELTQSQIRNTALRFRFATITQKFGSYNTYWKRVIRQIERGEYIRDVTRASRRMQRRGEDLPDELLVKLPKRVRERILRDREALAKREARKAGNKEAAEAVAPAAPAAAAAQPNDRGVFELGGDDDFDLDAIFKELEAEDPKAASAPPEPTPAPAPQTTPAPRTVRSAPPGPAPQAARSPAAARPAPGARPAQPQAKRPGTPMAPPRLTPVASKPAAARVNPRPPPGMSESEGRELYEKYAKARRLVGDSRPVTYDQLMKKLGQQAPKIMRDHNASKVDFSVVIKGDKVVLKAKPRG